ncbi:N-acetylmuramoyl-L-alanine amidase [Mucilaginibacter limnophilus]|uniref:N-acetylmuramoyl-L-alanine amidase n=1 Tax=Mucilaginibacter limnophilus TaxID=1932778 RepID=A0A3S3TF31_9SPHI|nr:N-acetylmuramoyl-L-alanine amidase [Mucilaginibacter limnophilus]RVT98342.1 N-acetylmuramoyl-L-alanine amidase [Mucilaginibacter limnophilus]
MPKHHLLLLLTVLILTACSPKGPYAVTNKVYKEQAETFAETLQSDEPVSLLDSSGIKIPSEWVGTVNFNLRKPNYVVIHYTAQDSAAQTLKTFTMTKTQVSAHYVVGKDGKVYHMLNDYLRAWHGGVAKWGSVTDINSSSIGIELDNNGKEPFATAQINSLLTLLAHLKKTYNIPTANFIGHQDIAPARKIDPGKQFPWKLLAQKGFGYWSDDVLELAPENFDVATALRLIGYDTANPTAAIAAFKQHFVQVDNLPQLSQLGLNVLYNLYQKY